jgi:transposase
MMLPPATRVYLACGFTDMRRGFDGLAAQVQTVLSLDPYGGALFVFRGRRGDRATLCILPFRDLVGGVSCRLASRGSCSDAGR